jgi:tetratricopeptide (TPR) repeat protein
MEEDEVTDYLLIFIGESYEKAGQYDEAIVQYSEAYRMNPENFDACTGMAICLMEKREFQQSMSWYDKALKINEEDPELWVYIAELMLLMEMKDEAYVSYLRSLTLKKDQADVLAAMGNISFDNGEYEKALGLYLVASSIDPEVPGLNLFFALTYAMLGMEEAAEEYLAKAKETDENAEKMYLEILSEASSGTGAADITVNP